MEKNCPCCEKHCPAENLRCSEGRRHFGKEDPQRSDGPQSPEARTIVLLRKCGHFLHHNMGGGEDVTPLLDALTADERATLESLLEKCLKHWDTLPRPERPTQGDGHGPRRH